MMNIVKNLEQLQQLCISFDECICNSDGDALGTIATYELCILFHPDDISEEEVRKIVDVIDPRQFAKCVKEGSSIDSRFVIMHESTFESFKDLLKRER